LIADTSAQVDTELLCRLRYQVTVLEENFSRRETGWLQNKLALKILDFIERMAIAVSP